VSVPAGVEGDVAFALEAGPEMRHATIAVGWRRPDGAVLVEAVEGFAEADGPVLARASDRLAELVAAWAPAAVAVVARSRSEAAAARAVEGSTTPLVAVNAAELVRATNGFHEAVLARRVVHPADPMLAAHVACVTSDGPLRRRSAAVDVDGATAAVLARHAALNAPERVTAQDWTAF
jgi:hypothetical protein